MAQRLKAHVHNGQIVLDEPLDLPEGTAVRIVPIDGDDEMDANELAALEQAIEEGFEDFEAGRHSDARAFAKHLLTRR